MLKTILIAAILAFSFVSRAQTVLSYSEASAKGMSIDSLDRIYKIAGHADPALSGFKGDLKAFQEAYDAFTGQLTAHLVKQGVTVEKEQRVQIRVYFNPEGGIDYLFYQIRSGQFSEKVEKSFSGWVLSFIKDYRLPMTNPERFSQNRPLFFRPAAK